MFLFFRKKKKQPVRVQQQAKPRRPREVSAQDREKLMKMVRTLMELLVEQRQKKVPETGPFSQIGVVLDMPGKEYSALVTLGPGNGFAKRVINAGVHPADSDRMVSNYFFFDSTAELDAWLKDPRQVEEMTQTLIHLWESAAESDR